MLTWILTIVFGISTRRKQFAVRQIHGYRRITNMRAELASASTQFWLVAGPLWLISTGLVAAVNHVHQMGRWIEISLVSVAILYLFQCVLITVSTRAFDKVCARDVIKGEQLVRRVAIGAACVQALILVFGLLTINTGYHRLHSLAQSHFAADQWLHGPAPYKLEVALSTTHDDMKSVGPAFAKILAHQDAAGTLLISHFIFDHSTGDYMFQGDKSILVNAHYLDRQKVLDADGHQIASSTISREPGTLTLLVPENLPTSEVDNLISYYARAAKAEPAGPDVPIYVMRTKQGQSLATFSQTDPIPLEDQRPALVTDPVLAVAGVPGTIFSPTWWVGFASTGGVLFEDLPSLRQQLAESSLNWYFDGYRDATVAVKQSVALSIRFAILDGASAIIAAGALSASVWIMAAVYCSRTKRQLFLQRIHGYDFARRHRGYLILSAALLLIAAAISAPFGTFDQAVPTVLSTLVLLVSIMLTIFAIHVCEARSHAVIIKQD